MLPVRMRFAPQAAAIALDNRAFWEAMEQQAGWGDRGHFLHPRPGMGSQHRPGIRSAGDRSGASRAWNEGERMGAGDPGVISLKCIFIRCQALSKVPFTYDIITDK